MKRNVIDRSKNHPDSDIFILNPNVKNLDLLDAINKRLHQALALTEVMESSDPESYSEDTMANFCWNLEDILNEVIFLQGKIHDEVRGVNKNEKA